MLFPGNGVTQAFYSGIEAFGHPYQRNSQGNKAPLAGGQPAPLPRSHYHYGSQRMDPHIMFGKQQFPEARKGKTEAARPGPDKFFLGNFFAPDKGRYNTRYRQD